MLQMILEPAIATGIAFGYNKLFESNSSYSNLQSIGKYSLIVGGSNLVGNMLVEQFIPTFKNQQLLNLQKVMMSTASTTGLNFVGQRFINNDVRFDFNLQAGAIAGGGASVVSHFARNILKF